MKIMVINPNTSEEMTGHIREELERIRRPETELMVVCPRKGPVAIESSYDEILAAFHSLELVREANEQGYDAVVLACFADPGLVAMKEISDILVVGIQEASFHAAAMLGDKFTILTPMKKRIPSKYNDVWRNKMPYHVASVRELGMTVTETEQKPELAQQRIMEVSRKAVEEDGAEVIILGCAGMVGYAEAAAKELNVIVIDPTSVAFKYAEAMAEAGLCHSKRALYAAPSKKEYKK